MIHKRLLLATLTTLHCFNSVSADFPRPFGSPVADRTELVFVAEQSDEFNAPEVENRGNQELFYKSGIARSPKTITYGYFDARVKGWSRYPGASPAFWLQRICTGIFLCM